MTTVRWNDEMLDQLSETVQSTSETVQRTSETVDRLSETVDRLSDTVDRLSEASFKNEQKIDSVARTFEAIATQMTADREERNLVLQVISRQQDQLDRHQSEIRGLRIETRRMLNYLLNEQESDSDDEGEQA